MKNRLWLLTLTALALTLTACGGRTAANSKNFSAAISEYLKDEGELCLSIDRWPVDAGSELGNARLFQQMEALEAAGLVVGEQVGWGGITSAVTKRYTPADAAEPFMRDKEVDDLFGRLRVKRLCWGEKTLDKVVKWEDPIKVDDYQEVSVVYTYKVDNVADWAKDPAVQAAFPEIRNTIAGAGTKEVEHGLTLGSEGWET